MMDAPTLLADVGGTNVRFALARPDAALPLDMDSVRVFRVAEFGSFAEAATAYLVNLRGGDRPQHAVLAVAGRILDNEVRITNHPWTISFAQTRRMLGLVSCHAINDFAAMSLGLPLLAPHESAALGQPAAPAFGGDPAQTFAVLGPCSGLGVGALLVRDGRVVALQTEGGHVGVAPVDAIEFEVLALLQRRFGRVSLERLLSGSGLVNLHAALAQVEGRDATDVRPEDITANAASAPENHRTLEIFCNLLGAAAGDFVLAYGAWQGAWLCGGLTPHVLPWLQADGFRARFENKGRFAEAMRQVPVRAVVHPHPGLLGAAAQAMLDAGNSPLPTRALLRGEHPLPAGAAPP